MPDHVSGYPLCPRFSRVVCACCAACACWATHAHHATHTRCAVHACCPVHAFCTTRAYCPCLSLRRVHMPNHVPKYLLLLGSHVVCACRVTHSWRATCACCAVCVRHAVHAHRATRASCVACAHHTARTHHAGRVVLTFLAAWTYLTVCVGLVARVPCPMLGAIVSSVTQSLRPIFLPFTLMCCSDDVVLSCQPKVLK